MFFVMSMGETADLKDGNHSRTVDGAQGKRNSAHETSCGSVPQAPASSSRRPSPPSCAAEDPGREPRAQRHSSDAGSAAAAAAADCANGAQAPGSAAAPAPGCAPSRSSPEPMTAARRTPELGPDTARDTESSELALVASATLALRIDPLLSGRGRERVRKTRPCYAGSTIQAAL
ncbi:hypothetical protein HPB47_012670 [Ixodes persulcatus]|uniref:Uncharacterized protein n=1 Tax=Ixodes persulcatus TaxID=34615 RepID=A0AC60NSX1_IXOPE|nr:hypothetical protein HPB47_012670 [Ixodes persulcatus]